MPKSLGRMDRGFSLGSVKRSLEPKAAGLYPSKGKGLGEYGTVKFLSILEAYNRDSDFKRWKLGMDYYFGSGRTWGDYQILSLARFLPGAVSGISRDIVTLFPSKTSPEKAWYTGIRTRGSLILPQPIQLSDLTLNTAPADEADHTLTYDVSGILTTTQVAVWGNFVGDQFEDTASGTSYPDDIISKPAGSIALTLIAVSPGAMTLTFALSKAYTRIEKNGRIYWDKVKYDRDDPAIWNTSGSRHLCSSHKFFCCCPDHLGGAIANLDKPDGKAYTLDTFPLPNANRSVNSAWERQGVGYYRQWRSLSERIEERKECKHIHALRWQCGIPWHEPSDYPTMSDPSSPALGTVTETSYTDEDIREYFRNRLLSFDRYAMTLAEVVGLTIFPGGDVRENVRPSSLPMLWNDSEQPLVSWCRNNDWWVERGTQNVRIFNSAANEFRETITVGGVDYPVFETVQSTNPLAPVIVP